MTNTMAFATSTPTSSLLHSSSSYTGWKPSLFVLSNSAVSVPKYAIFQHVRGIPQLGFAPFSQWNGLKQLGISISQYSVKMERKGKCKGKGVYASLFGVGAPEALVIGVVALLVFGPKGLAEVARNLGKTLRAFQPTIRELQEVSREFKSTLEREIGLDEIDNPVPKSFSSNTPRPTPTPEDNPEYSGTNVEPNKSPEDNQPCQTADDSPSESGAYSADEYLKVTEAQLKGALARLQKEQEEEKERAQSQSESQTPSQDTPQEPSVVMPSSESCGSNVLQEEAASVVPPGPAPKPETDV
ncbi:hypothetical protein Pfo_027817 [Paulownia fortunei]|nr:hypothetical protein Pfo_027817 [Paulownia fortunei]